MNSRSNSDKYQLHSIILIHIEYHLKILEDIVYHFLQNIVIVIKVDFSDLFNGKSSSELNLIFI